VRRIEIEDIAMYYRQDGAGPPVLLLHGLGSSSEDWELQIPALAERYKVFRPDLRGHGASSKPSGRSSVELLARDVIALARRLGTGPLHVIGVSLGGMVAFQIALDAPELVRSLTILNSGPEMKLMTVRQHVAIVGRFLTLRLFGLRRMADELAKRLFPKPEQGDLRETFVARWSTNDAGAYERTLRGMIGWSVKARLCAIDCPVLVVSGDRDYTPVEAKARYVAELPNARLEVIEDSGHFTPFDQPARLNAILVAFLDEVTASAQTPARASASHPALSDTVPGATS